ncbi:hypothetical protein EJ04DRAFT_260160, partial [Polyplosphaeria fusca]
PRPRRPHPPSSSRFGPDVSTSLCRSLRNHSIYYVLVHVRSCSGHWRLNVDGTTAPMAGRGQALAQATANPPTNPRPNAPNPPRPFPSSSALWMVDQDLHFSHWPREDPVLMQRRVADSFPRRNVHPERRLLAYRPPGSPLAPTPHTPPEFLRPARCRSGRRRP